MSLLRCINSLMNNYGDEIKSLSDVPQRFYSVIAGGLLSGLQLLVKQEILEEITCKITGVWAGKMAHQIKAIVPNHEDLSSIPGTHVVEGENHLLQIIL